ncbi:MAG: M28 family peptidase [Gemmatimonadota bacterium]|nr:MAG: M28 family peptidase [Gemmatimonadota bacterium]
MSSIRGKRTSSVGVTMRQGLLTTAVALGLATASGCAMDEGASGADVIRAEEFDAHLRFLADDLLEGRAPGTRGSELAARYIASHFELAGLQPVVGDTSYLQPVPLLAVSWRPTLSFRARGGASFAADYGSDFVAWSSRPPESTEFAGELVFVGYGIAAPEEGWDDYKEVDVSGKVLLMLMNDPGPWMPSRFRGDTLTYYGLPDYKYREAARRGAIAAIAVHTRELVGYEWDVVENVRNREQYRLDAADVGARPGFEAVLGQEASETVVSMGGLDFPTLLESARSENFRPIETGVTVSASVSSEVRRLTDANVIGLLPGSDPELADEVVVFTSHYDNLGIGPPEGLDSIYNGAYDNASGTAMLIVLAQAFAGLSRRPARSVLFLAVTAEVPDLLGSRYYVQNPVLPLGRTVANVNLDGVNLWGPTRDVAVIAAPAAGLEEVIARSAAVEDLRLEGDRAPEQGDLYRSGQFSFVEAGVPAVYVGHGLDYIGEMPGWGVELMDRYREMDQHRPSDEYRPGLDMRGAVQQGRVAFRVGFALADARERPVLGGR